MCRLIRINYLLLISTFTAISVPDLSNATTKTLTKHNTIGNILISQSKPTKKESVSDLACRIVNRRGECDKDKGRQRGPSVCSIFPYSHAKKPEKNPALRKTVAVRLLVWEAAKNVTVEKIEINGLDSSFTWSHDVKENEQKEQKVNYIGSRLKPGKYLYKLTYKKPLNERIATYSSKIKFHVIEDKDNSFTSIMSRYKEKYGENLNDKNIVMERVKELTDKGLVSDAVQEILLVRNTSPKWNIAVNQFRDKFCPTSKSLDK